MAPPVYPPLLQTIVLLSSVGLHGCCAVLHSCCLLPSSGASVSLPLLGQGSCLAVLPSSSSCSWPGRRGKGRAALQKEEEAAAATAATLSACLPSARNSLLPSSALVSAWFFLVKVLLFCFVWAFDFLPWVCMCNCCVTA